MAAGALAACATTPLPDTRHYGRVPEHPPGPPPAAAPETFVPWSELPGWTEENHLAALRALQAGCDVARERAVARACADVRADPPQDDVQARLFFESHFRPASIPGEGLLTAYFSPEYEARHTPEPPFTAPVRPAPTNLDAVVQQALAESADAGDPGDPARPLLADGDPKPDRALIDTLPADDALAWMRPEDLFFLQIQGSGSLAFPDGERERAVFAGSNGQPFVGLARVMRERGLIADNGGSAEAIHAWLADHRGPEAEALMDANPRYVFFRLQPDDGGQPAGAAGEPLPAGRALAVDRSSHAFGELLWIDGEAPALACAFPAYRRLAVALDVGGAIHGRSRADLYIGRGDAAGREAGRVRHQLRMYRLVPDDESDTLRLAGTR